MRSRTLTTLALLLAVALIVAGGTNALASDKMRATTLEHGDKILAGVTLEESTPIVKINEDHDGFDGKIVQIEGTIVEICDNMGCWVELRDAEDNALRVKVDDGVVDFRELVSKSLYMVAEGEFQKVGEHGAQVFIMEHGAMVSKADD